MNEHQWRIIDGAGQEQGPYSSADLQSFYQSGHLNHGTMIWTEGLTDWVPAGQVEGLLPEIPQAAPVAAPSAAAPLPAAAFETTPSPQPATQAKVPGWVALATLLSGVLALILFAFPWVSLSVDISETKKVEMITMTTQSGLQSITQKANATDEFLTMVSKDTGTPVETLREQMESAESSNDFDRATLVLIAIIVIGFGVVLAIIGFANQSRRAFLIAQIAFIAGSILIGMQMAQQFPMSKKILEERAKIREDTKDIIAAQKEMAEAQNDLNAQMARVLQGEEKKAAQAKAEESAKEMAEAIRKTELEANRQIVGGYEPGCYLTLSLLGLSIIFLVVTLSTSTPVPLVLPSQGLSTQPGSGLKFH